MIPGLARARPLPDLSAARLGLALVALTGAAWVTGLPYLLVRLGIPFGIPLARIDGPHIFVGSAMAIVITAKVVQLQLRGSLRKLQGILRWQRWLALGLLPTYGGVLVTGLLLLLPWPGGVLRQLVNLHLLTAAWAGVLTAVHAGRYLRKLPAGTADGRFKVGVALITLPALALMALPAAASPLSRLGAGGSWQAVGPQGVFTTRVVRLAGGELAAMGTGLWTSADQGATWSAVPGLEYRLIRALATGPGGTPVYLGTDIGVLRSDTVSGSYRQLGPPGLVETVLVDPADPQRVWAGGLGLWTSTDGGASWSAATAGLVPRGYIWTLGSFGATLYAGGTTGIYTWAGAAWRQVSEMASVYSLDAGPNGEIWASSMGQGLAVLRGGRWQPANSGLNPHGHGGQAVHVDGFTPLGGSKAVVATMDAGVAITADGGASWSELSPGWQPGDVWQVLATDGGLLAATDQGLYRYRFAPAPAPTAAWWLLLVAGALTSTLAGAALGLTAARERALGPPSRAAMEPAA